MQTYPQATAQPILVDPSHLNSYDPSAPYRAMMMPPPPVNTNPVNTNPYIVNPNPTQNVPATYYDTTNPIVTRIPKYYYPRYDGYEGNDDPNALLMRERFANVQQPIPQQSIPNEYSPYTQPPPPPLPVDPYASGGYYPYTTSYLIPIGPNIPPGNTVPYTQEKNQSDLTLAHKKDGDLSRLEVYHFTPKQNQSSQMGTNASAPVIQYHVYPYPPSSQQPSTMPKQQQQYSPYYNPQYVQPSEHLQSQLPHLETEARSSQTYQPATKNRAISPMHTTTNAPIHDDDGYPRVHQQDIHTDRHNIRTGRINRQFYDNHSSPALPDCRCLDCQRERKEILNYYPD